MAVLTKNVSPVDQSRSPQLNVAIGGQQGMMQDPHEWTSSANYVRQRILPVLISGPALLKYMSNPAQQLAALKSLMELMAQKIDGLNSSVTWDYDGPLVGNAGEKFESAIKASRAVSAPAYTWAEKYGMAVTRYWTEYGRQLILDPDLGFPGIVSSPSYKAAGSPPILPEQQSIMMLFIEPDITLTSVTNAWLCSNMQPRSAGDIMGSREMGMTGEIKEVAIEFTAFTEIGKAVNTLANKYLDSLKLGDLRPLDLDGFLNKPSAEINNAAIKLSEEVTGNLFSTGA